MAYGMEWSAYWFMNETLSEEESILNKVWTGERVGELMGLYL
jgi:hypothetical protein